MYLTDMYIICDIYEKEKDGTYTYWETTTCMPGIVCFLYISIHKYIIIVYST